MADNIMLAKNGKRVFSKILQRLQRGSNMSTGIDQRSSLNVAKFIQRVWVTPSTAADPSVDAGSQATYPVAIGDLAYRKDTDEVFICSVAPAAATAATFIQMHA